MPEDESRTISFDQWFNEWFGASLQDSKRALFAELQKIGEGLKDVETLVPVLNAAAAGQNIRTKALADLLRLLSADLTAVQNSVSTSLRDIEILRRKINLVMGSPYIQ
jgi:hypothetical protein